MGVFASNTVPSASARPVDELAAGAEHRHAGLPTTGEGAEAGGGGRTDLGRTQERARAKQALATFDVAGAVAHELSHCDCRDQHELFALPSGVLERHHRVGLLRHDRAVEIATA